MSRPLLLDLFCGAGGAAVGYHRAGFDVVGVGCEWQLNYPFSYVQDDALEFLGRYVALKEVWPRTAYGAIHASPPCQPYSSTKSLHDAEYAALIPEVRSLLQATGLPYVIENVVGAPLVNPVKLCGSSFGLGVRRHRLFETNFPVMSVPCAHWDQPEPIDVTGGGPSKKPRTDGAGGRSRKPRNLAQAREAMGIDWMSRSELNEAIPPTFTEYVGRALLEALEREPA